MAWFHNRRAGRRTGRRRPQTKALFDRCKAFPARRSKARGTSARGPGCACCPKKRAADQNLYKPSASGCMLVSSAGGFGCPSVSPAEGRILPPLSPDITGLSRDRLTGGSSTGDKLGAEADDAHPSVRQRLRSCRTRRSVGSRHGDRPLPDYSPTPPMIKTSAMPDLLGCFVPAVRTCRPSQFCRRHREARGIHAGGPATVPPVLASAVAMVAFLAYPRRCEADEAQPPQIRGMHLPDLTVAALQTLRFQESEKLGAREVREMIVMQHEAHLRHPPASRGGAAIALEASPGHVEGLRWNAGHAADHRPDRLRRHDHPTDRPSVHGSGERGRASRCWLVRA
ncbi:hypothetical protein BW41_03275 [Sphingomonas sp. RIT328]|nr:hypothetical protein BW41_03275 [Sphingomonas sp. RIT328]